MRSCGAARDTTCRSSATATSTSSCPSTRAARSRRRSSMTGRSRRRSARATRWRSCASRPPTPSATNDIPPLCRRGYRQSNFAMRGLELASRSCLWLVPLDPLRPQHCSEGTMRHETVETGKLITFEGGEGAGKSTQVAILVSRLRSAGREVDRHPRAGRIAVGGGNPRDAAFRQGPSVRSVGRGAAVLGRPRRIMSTPSSARLLPTGLGRLRPLPRFHARLSGRRRRRAAGSDQRARARDAARGSSPI